MERPLAIHTDEAMIPFQIMTEAMIWK